MLRKDRTTLKLLNFRCICPEKETGIRDSPIGHQHCKDKGYKVKLWYIGNECYKGWIAEGYAKDLDEYAKVLKSVDPDITIIGDWKFGPESKNRFEQTLTIATLSKEIDIIEVHEKYSLKKDWELMRDGYNSKTVEGWQIKIMLSYTFGTILKKKHVEISYLEDYYL